MTKKEAVKLFKARWRERVRQVPAYAGDKPAERQDFSFFLDELYSEGRITAKQVESFDY
jgi:hypothetical protein